MKYRILIDQQSYDQHEEFDSLDVVDIGIMECIADFAFNRCNEKINAADGVYYWISHSTIISDFPRCGIKSKSGIRKRIKILENAGLIKLYDGSQSLGRSYYKITDRFNVTRNGLSRKEQLQNVHPSPQSVEVQSERTTPYASKGQDPSPSGTDDYINNNYNNNNTIYEEESSLKKIDVISELVEVYNSLGEPFRKVMKITKPRRKKANERLKEIGSKEEFISIIKSLPKYPFLCGQNQRGWVADFDFLIANPDNWVKVSEGKYKSNEVAKESKGKLESYHNTTDAKYEAACEQNRQWARDNP